ncbi:hypothetical protein FOA52_006975 [Chlamydomonas sp. UWO 241]|nr:hypothetical protein FOA52_006975 [Chlamydomonas sp. UWO 241]
MEIQDAQVDTAACHAVFFSPDLSPQLLSSLDRASKVALRCVSKAMRIQVDASIKVVASPVSGFSADALSAALVRWSGMHDLTLLGVSGTADLVPLATASLAGLRRLTMREADLAEALDVSAFSSSMATTLQLIDVSGCYTLMDIDFARSCVKLRCLWMPGCVRVLDLSPLAACSEALEELWMAASYDVSLAPLKACTKLRKLDLRGCKGLDLQELEDLRLACTKLEDPTSVELEGLVHDLQPKMSPNARAGASKILADACHERGLEAQTAIAAAGAIPALVQLLGPVSSADVQTAAAGALGHLAAGHAQNQAAISAAGAIPALVALLKVGDFNHPQDVHRAAGAALRKLPGYRDVLPDLRPTARRYPGCPIWM